MQKTEELFDIRNERKKSLEFSVTKKKDIRKGEFRWYREGINLGNEISKDGGHKRVCIVLQTNLGNGLICIAPITTKFHKRMEKQYIKVEEPERYGLKECRVVVNQIKLVDKKRFYKKTSDESLAVFFAEKVLYAFRKLLL